MVPGINYTRLAGCSVSIGGFILVSCVGIIVSMRRLEESEVRQHVGGWNGGKSHCDIKPTSLREMQSVRHVVIQFEAVGSSQEAAALAAKRHYWVHRSA